MQNWSKFPTWAPFSMLLSAYSQINLGDSTLRKMLGWINQILVGSTIEHGYYTENQIFGWAKKIFG